MIGLVKKNLFIIAEAGVNHNGNLEIAKKMIDIASISGADAVKFQTFNADTLASKSAQQAQYQLENTGIHESQHEMLKKLELKKDHHIILKQYCETKKIEFMSSPFDLNSVDFLENLGVKRYKIPSGEITNKPLLEKIAGLKKPTILSTGMCNLKEIRDAVTIFKNNNFNMHDLTILHAVSDYPASPLESNMSCIRSLKEDLNLNIGYSDHTETDLCAIMAVSQGATVIEKHFTLDKEMPGPDHKASLEPNELQSFIKVLRKIESYLGDGIKNPSKSEIKNIQIVRKSIVASKNILKGELFTMENITTKRPGTGISPMKIESVIGEIAKKDFLKDECIEI